MLRSVSSAAKPVEDDLREKGEEDADEAEDKPLAPVAGMNRFVWDLRRTVPSLIMPRYSYGDFPPQGVRVAPGAYTVRLTVGSETMERPFDVRANPAVTVAPEDLKAQADFVRTVTADLAAIHRTLRRIKDVKAQVDGLVKRASAIGKGEGLKGAAESLTGKLQALEDELYNPNLKVNQDSLNYLPKLDFQFAGLAGVADSADAKPTSGILARYQDLKAQLADVMGRVTTTLDTDLTAFNKAVVAAGIPPVVLMPFDKTN